MMKKNYTDGFFNVSSEHGFLPEEDPLAVLGFPYEPLQKIIDCLPDLHPNLDKLDDAVASLPLFDIKHESNIFVIQALFRAYAFLCSAYLLAPAQLNKKDGIYGRARNELPANLAVPLECAANKLRIHPWLDYHYAYSLGNYVRKEPDKDLHWKNLEMACSFTGSQDEVGFIMDHVYINEVSKDIVKSVHQYFEDQQLAAVQLLYRTLIEINARRKTMWQASNHKHYNNFRAFILGIKGNTEVFGKGVKYVGTNNPDEYRQYRGQTGAQDDIIPTCDIFTGITKFYPTNELTDYLMDLRQYRPKCVQAFLQDLEEEIASQPMRDYFIKHSHIGLVYLLASIDQVYLFRNGHWQFVQKYIMANTRYPVATGGTPIISWLPNQIEACLVAMQDLISNVDVSTLPKEELELYNTICQRHTRSVKLLNQQKKELKSSNFNAANLFELNKQQDLEDEPD